MDAVEPFESTCSFYHFKEGDWVNLKQPLHRELHTRRGQIKDVVDGRALVIDERTSAEVSDNISVLNRYTLHELQFNVDTRNLEICEVQGPSLPKSDPVNPLMGQNVIVSCGPLKGLYGRVKDVGTETLTVELEAKVASSNSSRQPIMRNDISIV